MPAADSTEKSASADDCLLVLVAAPLDAGPALARGLIEARLAACVQILPMRSLYRWQGAIEDAQEAQLSIKTTRARYPALQEWLRTAHPYEVPEILAVAVAAGLPAYLQWVHQQTS